MGVEPFLITASLSGVLAQRLSRRLCPSCKKETRLNDQESKWFEKLGLRIKNVCRAGGCRDCLQLGYKGREGMFELLVMSDAIRQLIMQGASAEAIKKQAMQEGMTFLEHHAFEKLQQGLISPEEFFRSVTLV